MSLKNVYLPKLGFFARFHDRHAMKKGHPVRRFKLPPGWTAPPLPIDYAKSLVFPMDGNDQYGDCMYAAACHADQTFTGNATGTESTFDERTLVRDYLSLAGGDNGLDEETLIRGWKGGLAGVKDATILDALDVDTTDPALMRAAVGLFGGVLFMLDVPDPWCNTGNGEFWDVPARADRNNGHGVFINGVDADGNYHLLTWGGYRKLTPAGLRACDPSGFVVFSLRWFNANGVAPNGKTYDELAKLWAAAGGKALPPNPFPVPPTPPPTPTPAPGPCSLFRRLSSLFAGRETVASASAVRPQQMPPHYFGLTVNTSAAAIDWSGIIAWIKSLLATYGPEIVPVVSAWIDRLSVSPFVKIMLHALLTLLASELNPPAKAA